MPVCCFDRNYGTKYKCEYEIKDNYVDVTVEYEISDEIEQINGVRAFGANTTFDKRDILIIDYKSNKNILMKGAYFIGKESVFGTPDGGSKTKFQTGVYFVDKDFQRLCNLPDMPKAKKIKIFSTAINELIGYPSLTIESSDSEYSINLSRQSKSQNIEINSNYIKSISIADTWNSISKPKEHYLKVDFSGYIEIELTKRVNYDLVYEFVNELNLYMELYRPNKFNIDKISIMVDKEYYELKIPLIDNEINEEHIEESVSDEIINFLKKCYTTIPYRNSNAEIRNIPYIILKTSRGLEDNFMMFYRFIECYYKKQLIPNIKKTFISYSIEEHYTKKEKLSVEEIEKYSQEIVCLRNHYVHSGYYIKNSSLKITFERIGGKKNPKDYTVNNVDMDWIYDRTMILYKIVIDIIFDKMLGYKEYKFKRHF